MRLEGGKEWGRARSESGERMKLNFAHFLKGRSSVGGEGTTDACLPLERGKRFFVRL